jgi:hypothetical protein
MKRRTVLAGFGTALLTSGCLGQTQSKNTPTGDGPQPADTPSRTPESSPTTPDDPATEQPSDDFRTIDCPSFRDADVTVCAQTDNYPIMLQPTSTTYQVVQGNSTIETLDLTLSNTSDHSFGFNPHDWRLDRYSGDGWTKVAPEGVAEPWTNVAPNGQYEYELTTQQHPSPANGPHQIDVDLTSDVYALSIVGNWDTGRNGKRIECIALINVVVMSKESWPTPTTTPDP